MKQLNLYWLGGGGGSSVPDGRTVTPVNDVTLLQQCAGISNPTYTTLAQILADTGILQTILSNQNAVNYLVRCKGFIKPEFAPQMTSNTTPSGTATLDTSFIRTDLGEAWNAFDRNDSKGAFFAASSDAALGRCYYTKGEAFKPISAEILFSSGTAGKITYSDNGSTWTDIGSTISGSATTQKIDLSGQSEHMYWGFHLTSGTSGAYSKQSFLYELQFYEEGFCDSDDAMRYIGLNNYAANTLLNDSTWCPAICNSTYFERVLNVKVPVMTSDTTPSGECFASSVWYSSNPAWKAFDGLYNVAGDSWASQRDSVTNQYLGYRFSNSIKVCLAKVHGHATSAAYNPKNIKFQYLNDDVWIDVPNSATLFPNDLDIHSYVYSQGVESAEHRMFIVDSYATSEVDVSLLQFYGRKDV